jgi:type IV pilus assembly protein PilC
MKLRYKASTKEGKLSQGLLEAKDITEAANYLRAKQLTPIEITNAQGKFLANLNFGRGVKHSDLVLFTRQLSSMLASGLTLMRALEILKDQIQNPAMSDVISEVINDVSEGKTLAQAIDKHPKIFSPIYRSIIAAGEQSGLMDKVLARLADNLEKQERLKSTVKSALTYPVIVLILMGGVMAIMVGFVIPQLSGLYTSLHVDLPFTTKIIVGISNFAVSAWPITLGGIFLTVFLYRRWHKTPDGQLIVDSFLLNLPVFGKLIKESILAEFSRTLGLLIGTGTLVVQALNETADTAGNVLYKNAILEVCKKVEKGVSLGDSLAHYSLFPPLLVQLVRVGEQTGKMDETLLRASEYFEREVDQSVKTLTTAIEPFIMVFLGLGVGFLIISVITPIYSLITSIQ